MPDTWKQLQYALDICTFLPTTDALTGWSATTLFTSKHLVSFMCKAARSL